MPYLRLLRLSCLSLLLACGDGAPPIEPPRPAPVPTAVAITPSTASLAALGETVQLAAAVRDQNGEAMTGVSVNWASSDAGVATVSAAGLVTAVRNGSTSVTASAQSGTASGSATVTVTQEAVELTLAPATEVFRALGDTARLVMEAVDARGNPVADADAAWLSTDESVVTVDGTGLVTAVGNGTATVRAESGSAVATADFTVAQEVVSLNLSSAADSLWSHGDTLRLDTEALDANGHAVEDPGLVWSSTDETVATVDAEGLVTTHRPGSAEIAVEVAETGPASSVALHVILPTPRDILVILYNETDGLNWTNSRNWLTDAPLDTWYGVDTRSSGDGVIEELDLRNNGLAGPIPPQLGLLADLETLILPYNALVGSMPPQLRHMKELETLWLSSNQLSGPLPPELGSLAGLQSLSLSDNRLTGPIPLELASLPRLWRLHLGHNELSGQVPPELGSLAQLEELLLDGNSLTGPIPREIGNLGALRQLQLGHNDLTGPIPAELGGLTKLEDLLLSGNRLSGSIPPTLGKLTEMLQLTLGENELSGPIPRELGGLTKLEDLQLSNNAFTGAIPPALGNLASLTKLWLDDNELTGPLPREFANLVNLTALLVDNNDLSGAMPQGLIGLRLDAFRWNRTGLCAPANDAFQMWLRSIRIHVGGAACSS